MLAKLEKLFEDHVCFSGDIENNTTTPLPAGKGVVLFTDEFDRPIQLLMCGDIRRRVKGRLFESGEDEGANKKVDLSAVARKIYYVRSHNDLQMSIDYYSIGGKLFGHGSDEVIKLPKQYFVKIDPGAKWPFYRVSDSPACKEGEKVFGPFVTNKSGHKFLNILEESFGLCRRRNLVDNPAKAESCPYLQMDRCMGPCVGRMGMDEYYEQVAGSIAAAGGKIDIFLQQLKREMLGYSKKMEFEKAEQVKKRMLRLEQLDNSEFKWVSDLDELAVVHIDKWTKEKVEKIRKLRQNYICYIIRSDGIFEGGVFSSDNFGEVIDSVAVKAEELKSGKPGEYRKDYMSMLGYFLYRSSSAGLWIDCRGTVKGANLKDMVEKEYFPSQD